MDDIEFIIEAQRRANEQRREMQRLEIERAEFQARVDALMTVLRIHNLQLLGLMYSAFNPNLYRPQPQHSSPRE